jgi:hypothetical protein
VRVSTSDQNNQAWRSKWDQGLSCTRSERLQVVHPDQNNQAMVIKCANSNQRSFFCTPHASHFSHKRVNSTPTISAIHCSINCSLTKYTPSSFSYSHQEEAPDHNISVYASDSITAVNNEHGVDIHITLSCKYPPWAVLPESATTPRIIMTTPITVQKPNH